MTRLSKVVLIVDACFFLFMGISSVVFDRMSHDSGTGMMGKALLGTPHVLGYVEAHLLVAVIGVGLMAAAFTRPSRVWHVFAIVAHGALMYVDLTYQSDMAQLGIATGDVSVIAGAHIVLVVGHLAALVRAGRSGAVVVAG